MPCHHGKRRLDSSVLSQSNPLLKMKNLFTAPGKHISQCTIKTGKKAGTYITLHDSGVTAKGVLPKKIALAAFEEKGNSYWSTAGANSSGKCHIKASSSLWLGCFSTVFLNNKPCLASDAFALQLQYISSPEATFQLGMENRTTWPCLQYKSLLKMACVSQCCDFYFLVTWTETVFSNLLMLTEWRSPSATFDTRLHSTSTSLLLCSLYLTSSSSSQTDKKRYKRCAAIDCNGESIQSFLKRNSMCLLLIYKIGLQFSQPDIEQILLYRAASLHFNNPDF